MDGARAGRTEEYAADDIVLEHPLEGAVVPVYGDEQAGVGVVWVERRRLAAVEIDLVDAESVDPSSVRLEVWEGPTLFQGRWVAVDAQVERIERGWRVELDGSQPAVAAGLRKVRWVFPAPGKPVHLRRIRAFSGLPVHEAVVEVVGDSEAGELVIEPYNAALAAESEEKGLRLSYPAEAEWPSEKPVLRIWKGGRRACAVGVLDVLEHGCVHVPAEGIFLRALDGPSREEYLAATQGRETVLQRVRDLREQTFARAMERTRNPVQDNGPTLLSLACGSPKFIVHQNGDVQFRNEDTPPAEGVMHPQEYPSWMSVRFEADGELDYKRRLSDGWYPAPVVTARAGELRYTQRTYVAPAGPLRTSGWPAGPGTCVSEFAASEPEGEEVAVQLKFRSYDRDPGEFADEGGWFSVRTAGRLMAVVLPAEGVAAVASSEDGTVTLRRKDVRGEQALGTVLLPDYAAQAGDLRDLASTDLYGAFRQHWDDVLGRGAEITVPDDLLNSVIRASQAHCMLAARNEADGARISPWIASMAYGPLESEAHSIIRGMGMLGHEEWARRALDFFISRYSPEGYLTTGYTVMGTGWHLWTVGRHWKLYRDNEWMRANAGEVARMCRWVMDQAAKTRRAEPIAGLRVNGLMPPGVMADWGNYGYYFYLNGYYHAGLQWAGEALQAVGHPDAEKILAEAEQMGKDIRDAFEQVSALAPVEPLQDGTWVRPYPSQVHTPGRSADFFPGEDGNRSWAYDVELGAHHLAAQGVLDPHSPQVEDMLNHMEDVQFLAGGWHDYPSERSKQEWFDLGGFGKVQPYYGRYPEIYALRRDVTPFLRSYFNMLASLLNTQNLSLWEHFNNVAAWNKTHETGYFLQQTRMMVANEYGSELWILPLAPAEWMEPGKRTEVKDLPTAFGPVSFRVERSESGVVALIQVPEGAMDALVLRIPLADGQVMRGVEVNGFKRDASAPSGIIRLRAAEREVEVRAQISSR